MTTTNENLIANLGLLGLKKDQAIVYLAVLELGAGRVWDIAQKSGVKRPTCYLILDQLAKLGFVSQMQEKKHREFIAISPKRLLSIFDQKKQIFAKNINELIAVANQDKEKPVFRLLEGIEGIKQAYNLTLDLSPGSEILTYSRNEIEQKYPDFFHQYLKARVEKGIKARGIFPDSVALINTLPPRDKFELRQSRFIPGNKFDPLADTTIFGNKVIQISYAEKEPFATVIKSNDFAHDEKQKFELLWDLSQEFKKD
jgi:sugar-specific transcriptional regulator TrmB